MCMGENIEIPIFDGITGFDILKVKEIGGTGIVLFIAPAGAGVFHIEDPKGAKKLRKLLKPLADRA